MKKTNPGPWLTLLEATKYLKISKETLYRLVYRRKIPVHRLGKLYRFNTTELDRWLLSK